MANKIEHRGQQKRPDGANKRGYIYSSRIYTPLFAPGDPLGCGSILRLDQQEYELIRTEDYVRKDGVTVGLMVWESSCPSCGERFEAKIGENTLDWHKRLNRRCADCTRAGKPVKGRRGRRLKVELEAA